MSLFCMEKHYHDWKGKQGADEAGVFRLDAQEALVVAQMLFRVDA